MLGALRMLLPRFLIKRRFDIGLEKALTRACHFKRAVRCGSQPFFHAVMQSAAAITTNRVLSVVKVPATGSASSFRKRFLALPAA